MSENRRVLIIDDNPSIHADFRKILQADAPAHSAVGARHANVHKQLRIRAIIEG